MKKVLFILFALISITTQAQTANGTETKQNAFRSLSPQTVTSPTYLATMGTDGTIGRALPDNITNEARIAVNDVSYIISGSGNKLIAYTAITADRTVTLPLANVANQRIWITDESGLCSNSRRIIVQPNGSDVIGGDSFSVINFPNGSGYLESNGAGKWNIISTTSVQFSSGVNTLPSYTDNGNGSVTLGTGVYSLYANTTGVGRPKAYQIAGGTFTLTDNSTNYIYAQYNTTTGAVSLQQSTTDAVINDLTTIPVFSIYRQGLTLHARDFDTQGVALANKLNRSIQQTQKVRVVEGGVLLGETTSPAVRTVTISAGTAWVGATEISLPAVNSATSTCYRIFPVAGVYQTTTTVTQYDNQQYSDGTNLQTLTTNNYGVRFIYRSIGNDNDMAIVVGEGNNSLGQAQVSVPPANLPAFLRHMTLVGRIIVKKGDDFATQIDQNTGGTSFASAGVTDHNALNNLQTAQTGVTYGHINDGAQTIAGDKTFLGAITSTSLMNDDTLFSDNQINEVTSNIDNAEIAINFRGYLNGVTRFRNFTVYNGKGVGVFGSVGSTGLFNVASLIGTGNRSVYASSSGELFASNVYSLGSNFGVNTPSPSYILDVNSNSSFAVSSQFGNKTGNRISILNDDGGNRNQIDSYNSTGAASNFSLSVGGTESIRINTDTSVKIPNLSGTGTRTVVADASGNLSATSTAPTSGTYTPTYTNTANVSSFTHQRAFYSVVDKVVHVTIKLVANVTSATAATAFEVTTPSTRSSSSFVLVTGSARGDLIAPVMTTGDTTTSAFIEFKPPTGSTATAISVILNMSYEIP